ncbi:hypothetical protein ACFZ8E_07580 [Methylobacterium sp. HMF5984]|uniref:hypothetical protein n=1 Tax=Methylobacterium sp. HMF5984 TaxID=3367370 RepID=UPI0038536BF4
MSDTKELIHATAADILHYAVEHGFSTYGLQQVVLALESFGEKLIGAPAAVEVEEPVEAPAAAPKAKRVAKA